MLRGHGGEIYHLARELGLSPSEIRDHSSNVSPLPPPEGLYDLLQTRLREIENLPEVDSLTLRECLAERYQLSSEQILPSSGTTEWIFAIPKVFEPRRVLILGPTYSDYADAAHQAGIEPKFLLAKEENNFSPPLEELRTTLRDGDLVFVCNPNNPTGSVIPSPTLREIIAQHPQALFVVDESYSDFVGKEATLLEGDILENLIILRSFSKIYRIPGLRLGFAIASNKLAERLWNIFLPWSVNRLAQIAGVWLTKQKNYISEVQNFIREERKRVLGALKGLPLRLFPSQTHFFLVKLPFEARRAWWELLQQYHILAREASNIYGLDKYFLRFALRSKEENDYLFKALKEVFS